MLHKSEDSGRIARAESGEPFEFRILRLRSHDNGCGKGRWERSWMLLAAESRAHFSNLHSLIAICTLLHGAPSQNQQWQYLLSTYELHFLRWFFWFWIIPHRSLFCYRKIVPRFFSPSVNSSKSWHICVLQMKHFEIDTQTICIYSTLMNFHFQFFIENL